MKNLIEKFTKHPGDLDETYLEHFKGAVYAGWLLFVASSACLIHAFFPFLFEKSATEIAKQVIQKRCIND